MAVDTCGVITKALRICCLLYFHSIRGTHLVSANPQELQGAIGTT